ncbi:ribonuclease HII [Holzapfeliella sp. He02]|uniref:Ribonuclease HII n=1 Tax=Holzapfeliella saturejae TaxID=3082953 RepID=A0ABU8SGA5_9LACO
MTISEIKQLLKVDDVQESLLTELAEDSRKGVQQALKAYYSRIAKQHQLKQAFDDRFFYERKLWQDNYKTIAGVDEVGRGPLAGPVVCAAVVLPEDFNVIEVNDSKQLSLEKREALFYQILDQALDVSIGIKSEKVIDDINIYQATKLAMKEAVLNLQQMPQHLLVDAMVIPVDIPQTKLIKGDAKSNSIAAASIVAKVIRDRLMITYDQAYPGYDFSHNAGYGTKKHLAGLKQLGATPIHRKTFSPVMEYL